MNISLATMRILLFMISFSQLSFGMNNHMNNQLLLDTQKIIFMRSDNKANIQATNKYWYKEISIQSPAIFTVDGYCGIDNQRMIRILLNAAYERNYKGVENILKNSNVLAYVQDNIICYRPDIYEGDEATLDLYSIVHYHMDIPMATLLKLYNITQYEPKKPKCTPSNLIIACLAGNSNYIAGYLDYERENREKALIISIDCDHGACVKSLLNDLYDDSNLADIIAHHMDKRLLLNKKILKHACFKKKPNALKELLAINHFDLNEEELIDSGGEWEVCPLLLDKVLELAEKDSEYNTIAELLKKYGAKTSIEIALDREEENNSIIPRALSCIIF